MPEGPEVKTVTTKLNQALQGQFLVEVDFLCQKFASVASEFQQRIRPYLPGKIIEVTCKGKYIYFKLCLQNDTIIYFHSHLRMTGKWLWTKDDHSRLSLYFGLATTQVNIITNEVYFSDYRMLGVFEILSETEQKQHQDKIGSDILTEKLDYPQWLATLDRSGKRTINICRALMDQDRFAGVGNYLKAEMLYAAKIHPDHSIKELNQQQLYDLYEAFYRIPQESLASGGLTISDYWDPDGKVGTFQKVVYNQSHDPLGYPVVTKKTKDGRTTHYVEEIQY